MYTPIVCITITLLLETKDFLLFVFPKELISAAEESGKIPSLFSGAIFSFCSGFTEVLRLMFLLEFTLLRVCRTNVFLDPNCEYFNLETLNIVKIYI